MVKRIRNPQDKARALQALAEVALKLEQPEQAIALLAELAKAATGIERSKYKAESWRLAREMADMITSVDGRIQAFSQILMIWAEKEALPAAKKKAAS